MNSKPEGILKLEENYNITLKETEYAEDSIYLERNCYSLNESGSVIALNLMQNGISKIEGFQNFTELIHLDFSFNEIQKIENLEALVKLKILSFHNNQVSKIENLNTLIELKYLYLWDNKISKLQNLDALIELKSLDASSNQILKIENLDDLVKLKNLELSVNKISKLENLDALIELKTLDLSGNQISKLENLNALTKLETLSLISNNISKLENINSLGELRIFCLGNNHISKLENLNALIELKGLEELSVSHNPLAENSRLNLKDIDNHLELILSKLKELNETKNKIILPVKIMLLGNHQAGKSTFLEYLQSNKLINRNNSTAILKIEDFPNTTKKGELPQAIIYDFGGQDYYHGLYQAFFSLDSINLLLWNKTTDKNSVRLDSNKENTRDFSKGYWLAQLKYAFNKEKQNYKKDDNIEPTFLVQTHADEDEKETWQNTLETHKVANEFYISLSENNADVGVNKASLNYLKQSILHEIEIKQVEEDKPTWYKPFLNYIIHSNTLKSTTLNTIIKYYNRENLTSAEKRRFLEVDLEQLALKGMILYYKNDKELKHVAWLNPSKTVEDIHVNILSQEHIKQSKGTVNKKEWKIICKDSKIERLLLLEKVIFYDEANENYIIPNYLPLAQDDTHYSLLAFGFLEPNFVLKFKYFIPFGIINQLICKFGNNPEYKAFWRDQLIFTYKGAKVFIRLDFNSLSISVFIQKDKPAELEQELFSIILKIYNNEDEEAFLEDEFERDYDFSNILEKKKFTSGLSLKSIRSRHYNSFFEYKSPEDMYLSIDGKHFVHHKTLESSELTQSKVSAFPLINNAIDETKPKEQSSMLYNNFTKNDKIKQMKKIFISYSRKDVDYKNELKKHLGMLSLFDIADAWSCEDISIGKWDTQIQKELEESDLIIYMLSANFFSSPYIIEKEVANVMNAIEKGKKKDVLCVVVSDFVGVDSLKYSNEDRPQIDTQNALLELSSYQYLPYDTITNKVSNNEEEKIISLKEHTNRNTIESALTQIVNKVREKLK